MSSSYKSDNYGLNIWAGSDVPQRTDFNSDNQILDQVISSHISDMTLHSSSVDKMQCMSYMYLGNGDLVQTIQLDFEPSGVIVCCVTKGAAYPDSTNSRIKTYISAACAGTAGFGVTIEGNTALVSQHQAADNPSGKALACLNESGMIYLLVAFRSSAENNDA